MGFFWRKSAYILVRSGFGLPIIMKLYFRGWFGNSKCEIWKKEKELIGSMYHIWGPTTGLYLIVFSMWLLKNLHHTLTEPPYCSLPTLFFYMCMPKSSKSLLIVSQHNNSRPKTAKRRYCGKTRFFPQLRKKPGIRISTQKKVGCWLSRYIYIL